MNVTLSLGPLISLIAGILILIVPKLLNYIVALYLIIIGALGLFGHANTRVAVSEPPAMAQSAQPADSERG
jgi:hypothetical protein